MNTINLPAPVSANRYWRHVGKLIILSREAKAFKLEAAYRARLAGCRAPGSGPVSITVKLLPRLTKTGKASLIRCDLDNALKVAIDALNGIAYADDSQVVRILAEIGEAVAGGGLVVTVEAA